MRRLPSIICTSLALAGGLAPLAAITVEANSVTPLSAVVLDQFGHPMPATITWSTTVGSLSASTGDQFNSQRRMSPPQAPLLQAREACRILNQ